MDFLTLHPMLALWLITEEEEAQCEGRPGRYAEAASGQKIFYDPRSITQDLILEAAFASQDKSAPTVDEAHAVFKQVEARVDRYAFEASGSEWHIRNRSTPSWGDPLLGRRWILLARGDETEDEGAPRIGRVSLEGHEVKDALAWLPLLDGRHTEEEIMRAARSSPARTRVLEALEAAGGFVLGPNEAFAIEDLPELLFVSHSSVFIRGEKASVLVNPAILTSTELLSFEGRRPFSIVSSVDALLVSHCHWDHLSFQTMIRVPRETTIFVPRAKHTALVSPPLKTYLEAFGFEDVREVDDWEKAVIGDIEITFVPFFGEPFGLRSRFDAFTYLIRTKGKTIYGSLNACHDEAGNMDPVFRRLNVDAPSVDVFLFGSSAQKHDPIYRAANMRHYSNELLGRPDLVRYHPNVDDVLRWCGLLSPKVIIPYANFVYFGATLPDLRFGGEPKPNSDAYWESLGTRAPIYAAPWRKELERLARGSASLVMLHPLQGLSF